MDGIFEPGDTRVLKGSTVAPSLSQRPALGGVDHDSRSGSDRVADRANAARLLLGCGLLAEPELHGAEPALDVASRVRCQLVERKAVPETVAAVRGQAIAIATEQAEERLAQRLAGGVPH